MSGKSVVSLLALSAATVLGAAGEGGLEAVRALKIENGVIQRAETVADSAFIDRDGNILARYESVRPWRTCSCPGAWAVLERPSIIVSIPALQRVPA